MCDTDVEVISCNTDLKKMLVCFSIFLFVDGAINMLRLEVRIYNGLTVASDETKLSEKKNLIYPLFKLKNASCTCVFFV